MTNEQRAEVLVSAIAVFAEHGVEATELADIARLAGAAPATLKQEFGSKESLFRTAVRAVAGNLVMRACHPLPEGSAVEQLQNFCGRGWEIMHTPTYAALHRLWVSEVPRYPDLAHFYAAEVYGGIHDMLVGILRRGIVRGEFRPVVPHAAARLIMAALGKQAFWCNHADAFGPSVGGGCNRVVADTLSILLGGLQPGRSDSPSTV
jgi:AcrR family transcriptional regulator